MKEINGKIDYKGQTYEIYFNLNVMQAIQEEYGTLEKWGELSEGANGEPDAKAVIFGLTEMINEGIEIANENSEKKLEKMTCKQVGRMISEIGFDKIAAVLNQTVINSTKNDEIKNG